MEDILRKRPSCKDPRQRCRKFRGQQSTDFERTVLFRAEGVVGNVQPERLERMRTQRNAILTKRTLHPTDWRNVHTYPWWV